MHRPVPWQRRSGALTRCETPRGSTGVPRGQRTAAAWQDCAVIHFSTSTRVHSYTVVDLRIHPNRPQIHPQVVTLAGPGLVMGASSQAGPGTRCERGGLWPGDSAGSPASGALSHKPPVGPATTCPLTGTRPRRAGPATPRRGLGARARQRARHRAVGAPDWHRVRWAGPGTPAGWQLRSIGRHGAA